MKSIWIDNQGKQYDQKSLTIDKMLKIVFWLNKVKHPISQSEDQIEKVFALLAKKTIKDLQNKDIPMDPIRPPSDFISDANLFAPEPKFKQWVTVHNNKTDKDIQVLKDNDAFWIDGSGKTWNREEIKTDHLIRIVYWFQSRTEGIGANSTIQVYNIFDELKNRTIKRLKDQNLLTQDQPQKTR